MIAIIGAITLTVALVCVILLGIGSIFEIYFLFSIGAYTLLAISAIIVVIGITVLWLVVAGVIK